MTNKKIFQKSEFRFQLGEYYKKSRSSSERVRVTLWPSSHAPPHIFKPYIFIKRRAVRHQVKKKYIQSRPLLVVYANIPELKSSIEVFLIIKRRIAFSAT